MPHWTETVYRRNPDVFRHHLEDKLAVAAEETDDLLALLERAGVEPDAALDVGCGIGRHAVELADRGITVHGIDISEAYLDTARERAAEREVSDQCTFERGDMRELSDRSGEYDLVYNLWTSFGYYDEATNRAVLEGLYDRTADDGALVIELVNREGVLSDYQRDRVPENDERYVVESAEYDPETARMETTRRVFTETDEGYDYEGEMRYEVRLYSPVELENHCRDAGFSSISLYAGLDGAELERDSARVAAVAWP